MSPTYLFVYGTLRRGSHNRFAALLQSQARFVGAAKVAGRLYDLGRHPAGVRSDVAGEWVHGEVFLLMQPSQMLAVLDKYEGPNFPRARVPARLASGKDVEAWAYFCKSEPKSGRILAGEWFRRR